MNDVETDEDFRVLVRRASSCVFCVLIGCTATNQSPTIVASSQQAPRAATTVGSAVYWTTRTGIATLGDDSKVIVTIDPDAINPTEIVADTTEVYWLDAGTIGGANGSISRLTLSDGTITHVATNISGLAEVALDPQYVYWTSSLGLFRCPRAQAGQPEGVSLSAIPAHGLAVNKSDIFWTLETGDILRVGLDGGPPTTITTAITPFHLAANDTDLYWAEYMSSGSVYRLSMSDQSSHVIASEQDVINSIALRGPRVAWTTLLGGTIVSATLGGVVETIATDELGAQGIALSDNAAYWANENAGAIKMVVF